MGIPTRVPGTQVGLFHATFCVFCRGCFFSARELQSAQSGPAPALSRGFPGHTAIAEEGLSPLRTGSPQRRVVDNDDHGGAFSLPNNTPKSLPQKWQGNGEHASQHRRGCPGPAPTSGFASFQRACVAVPPFPAPLLPRRITTPARILLPRRITTPARIPLRAPVHASSQRSCSCVGPRRVLR